MGTATPQPRRSPHDFLRCRQFLALPPFSRLLSVCLSVCQAAKSSPWAQGSSQRYCPEPCNGRHTPGKKDGKWEFLTLLDPRLGA